MRYCLLVFCVFLTGCAVDHAAVGFNPLTGSASVDVTLKDVHGRVLYAPGQSHDPISNRALFAPTATRGAGACEPCGVTRAVGAPNPCAPVVEVKPSLRERFKNVVLFRSPHYIREIHDEGATPVTRALGR